MSRLMLQSDINFRTVQSIDSDCMIAYTRTMSDFIKTVSYNIPETTIVFFDLRYMPFTSYEIVRVRDIYDRTKSERLYTEWGVNFYSEKKDSIVPSMYLELKTTQDSNYGRSELEKRAQTLVHRTGSLKRKIPSPFIPLVGVVVPASINQSETIINGGLVSVQRSIFLTYCQVRHKNYPPADSYPPFMRDSHIQKIITLNTE